MVRHLLALLLLAAASAQAATESTVLVAGTPSRLVLQGSSNVAPWKCSGTTLDAAMEVAVPLEQINNVMDRIEDGDIARLDPAKASIPQPSFRLRIPVATLRCGNRQMESDMYKALRSSQFPMIEFHFGELVSAINHNIDSDTYSARASGVLTLAGARRNVTLDLEMRRVAPDRFRLRSRLPLRMTDFQVTPPTALFGMVKAKNDLIVDFDLVVQARQAIASTQPSGSAGR